jgi:N-acetylmuramoyl-L-alanine amidase
MNKPEYIIVHHSMTKDSGTKSWDAIRKYHIENMGMNDIGYHKGIEDIGGVITVMEGRVDVTSGAHTKELGMNSKSIGICVVGDYDVIAPPQGYLDVLRELCNAYMINYNIPTKNILGHREVGLMAGYDWTKGQFKTCPGRLFDMDAFREFVFKG